MRRRILFTAGSVLLLMSGYLARARTLTQTYPVTHGTVPQSYGRLAAAIPDNIGTGLVFEDAGGTIRFVSVTGMKEGELARYDQTPVKGGIPKAYGHLVAAIVNHGQTGLVFEDAKGAIRFVTLTGVMEGELTRE